MSATIYSAPSSVPLPKYGIDNVKNWQKEEDDYIDQLRAVLLRRKTGKNIGEVLRFQVADGYAMYMVASTRPLELVHLPLGDCYQFEYAHLLNAQEVQKKIDAQKALEELFGKKK
jgi:hypothetical protein